LLTISSPAFAQNGPIPKKYTSQGEDVSPPLEWSDAPARTMSYVLIVDDPDAPDPRAPLATWVHWVLYNIPAGIQSFAADLLRNGLPAGPRTGINGWRRTTYGGPAPPIGRHRYFHKLYALDLVLPDLEHPPKARLLNAMKGHVLAESQLIGTYQMSR
jgi:Raf kinase inhibitor-like YbhB/YbcL family protein